MPTFLSVVLLVAHIVHVADPPSSLSSLSPLFTVFEGANQFNQPLGDWDVSKVTTMLYSEWCPPSCLSSSLLPTLSMSLTLHPPLSLSLSIYLYLYISISLSTFHSVWGGSI